MRTESFLSYNIKVEDATLEDGIVPIGRQMDFIGDVETEQMILNDGDESLCLGYKNVKSFEPLYAGDMIDVKATLLHSGNSSRDCLVQTFKVATPAARMGVKDAKPGDMVWFDEPKLITEGNVRLVVRPHLQRGRQPDGIVKDPWKEIEY